MMATVSMHGGDSRTAAPARRTAKNRRTLAGLAFLAPAVVYIVAFFGYPLVYNLSMSVRNYTTQSFYTGEAPYTWWDNYRAVFHNPLFGKAVVNTAVFTVGS